LYASPIDGSFHIYDRTDHNLYNVYECPFLGADRDDAKLIAGSPVSFAGSKNPAQILNDYFTEARVVSNTQKKKDDKTANPQAKKKP